MAERECCEWASGGFGCFCFLFSSRPLVARKVDIMVCFRWPIGGGVGYFFRLSDVGFFRWPVGWGTAVGGAVFFGWVAALDEGAAAQGEGVKALMMVDDGLVCNFGVDAEVGGGFHFG